MAEAVAVEQIVAEHHGNAVVADEVLADYKRLGESLGLGLDGVGELQTELASVAEQTLELGRIVYGGDYEYFAYAREHERRQRIVYHRLVIYGQ